MTLRFMTALAVALLAPAIVQAQDGLTVLRGTPPADLAPAENFAGDVRVGNRFQLQAPSRVYGATVAFEPGSRTYWHVHALGQTLVVTDGIGRVQQWGGPIQEVRPGDVVLIPPGVKHWHGASPDAPMTHVALAEMPEDGSSTEWMEAVSDEQYAAGSPPSPSGSEDDGPSRA